MMCDFNIVVLFLFALSLSNTGSVLGLYEDQVGKFDWRHQFIGQLKYISYPVETTQNQNQLQTLTLATRQNVLGSVYIRNGSLAWRQILENGAEWDKHDQIDAVGGFYMVKDIDEQTVITVNSNGKFVRSWNPYLGLIKKEVSLPADIIGYDEEEGDIGYDSTTQMMFYINIREDEIILLKFSTKMKQLQVHFFDLNTGTLKKSLVPMTLGSWFKSKDTCTFVGNMCVVCIDEENFKLHYLSISTSENFISLPVSNFGLQSTSRPKYLRILTFPSQDLDVDLSVEPYFAIDLGGDGFAFLRVENEQLKLIKIFPALVGIAVAPLTRYKGGERSKFGCFVLIKKPENLNTEKDDTKDEESQDDANSHQFKVAVFDLDTWTENKDLSGHFTLKRFQSIKVNQMHIILFRRNTPAETSISYKVLLATDCGSLILASSQGKVSWIREEALSAIVSSEILDLPLSELDGTVDQAYNFGSANIVTQFTSRIAKQLFITQNYIINLIHHLINLMNPSVPQNSRNDDDIGFMSVGDVNEADGKDIQLVRDKFGFHKVIVTLTAEGKVFGIDSLTSRIIWSFFDSNLKQDYSLNKKMPIWVQRTTANYPHSAKCTIVTKSGNIVSFDPITGVMLDKMNIGHEIKQAMLLNHQDSDFLKGLLIVDVNNKVTIYPKTSTNTFLQNKESYFILMAEESIGAITGYRFIVKSDLIEATLSWTMTLPSYESSLPNSLRIEFKRDDEHVHSQGRVLGDRSVLYKYLNPNLVAVVVEGTESGQVDSSAGSMMHSKRSTFITIHLIDAINGAIIYSTIHRRSKGPVHIVHTENSVVYSYYNEKNRRTEISSIECYEGKVQTNSTVFSSLSRPAPLIPPIIEHQTFIFPTGILTMTDTRTERGITNKHLLIALPSGGLLELPKVFLDPRRPVNPTMEHREEGLIPYIPELPIPSEGIINYNQTILGVRGIQTATTNLESTCLVFAFGLDVFYTRVTPSKTFDILKDDFDHLLICAVLVILIGFGYVSKWLASRKTLKSAWK